MAGNPEYPPQNLILSKFTPFRDTLLFSFNHLPLLAFKNPFDLDSEVETQISIGLQKLPYFCM